jgi:ABC-type glycerol-3-phosphate transport system substrate-binding protein
MGHRWSRVAALATAAVTALALGGCGATADSGSADGVVTIKFVSLAYQPPTVAAVKNIVDSFNASHPKIQVQLIQGSFDTINDQLVTQFQGGTAPDVIHSQASLISNFQKQGYLADLTPYLDKNVVSSVPKGVLTTVTNGEKIFGAPTELQSYVVFANTDLLKSAGVAVPTGSTLSWDDFQAMAKKATTDGHAGLGWGLKQPAATVMNLSLNFGGTYFSGAGADAKIAVADNELQVPKRMAQMLNDDKSLSPVSITQSGSDTLPGFYAGKYAMVVGADFVAQSIVAQAPKTFNWAVLPPLAGTSAHQAADPQTLSASEQSQHVKEAAEFINYYEQPANLASVAQGDWLIPATAAASDVVRQATAGQNGWAQILATGPELVDAPFAHATNFPRWKTEVAQPALQQFLAGKLDLDGLKQKFTDGWQ